MTFILIIEWKSIILNEITILKVRFRFFIQEKKRIRNKNEWTSAEIHSLGMS